jgi:hypothetical protein
MEVEAMLFQSVITFCANKLIAEVNTVANNDDTIRSSFKWPSFFAFRKSIRPEVSS